MLLTDEFDNQICLDCTKLEIIAGIYYIDLVYILANYSLQRDGKRRRFVISQSFYEKFRSELFQFMQKAKHLHIFSHNKLGILNIGRKLKTQNNKIDYEPTTLIY